jgi:hypothetical protein
MFGPLTCRDFYAMLVEDFDDFMAEPQSARRAWHCALTAYHLHEWVWGDWLKSNRQVRDHLKVNSSVEFLRWVEQHCVWFWYVQQLATGAKHFVRQPGSQPILVGQYGQGGYGTGPYGQGYLIVDLGEEAGDERYQTAASYLEVVVRFWRDFFRAYLPDPNLPASRHHSM